LHIILATKIQIIFQFVNQVKEKSEEIAQNPVVFHRVCPKLTRKGCPFFISPPWTDTLFETVYSICVRLIL